MLRRLLPIFIFSLLLCSARAQRSPTGADLPNPEEFVNAVYSTIVDTTRPHYYLVVGTDSCRFLKFDYDQWFTYHLLEPIPIQILNELSEKVYHSQYPYFWNQDRLRKAICITRRQADSLLSANPVFAHKSASGNENFVYSFSLPQFTDDGQFAVIDLNVICGAVCGAGYTCIFRLTTTGEWKLVGRATNWSS